MNLPLTNNPSETFRVEILGVVYQFRQIWNTVGFWALDILDVDGNPLAYGVRIVAKTELLRQYSHLPFELESITELDPTIDNFSEFLLAVSDKNG